MTPQSIEKTAALLDRGEAYAAKAFAIVSVVSVVDHRLEAIDHRVLCLLAGCSWGRPAELTHDEIADAVNCSKSTAKRATRKLEALGYVAVVHGVNTKNSYSAVRCGASNAPSAKPTPACGRCAKPAKRLTISGYCRACVAARDLRKRVAMAVSELGPAADAQTVAIHLKTKGLTKQIRRILESERQTA